MNQTERNREEGGVANHLAPTPEPLRLVGNQPNPFDHETRIYFEMRVPGEVEISISDLQGQTVKVIKEVFAGAGEKMVRWDATDWNARPVHSGFYFYSLRINNQVATPEIGKMLCIK